MVINICVFRLHLDYTRWIPPNELIFACHNTYHIGLTLMKFLSSLQFVHLHTSYASSC